jgi:mono/diheme cytochrome c family protein
MTACRTIWLGASASWLALRLRSLAVVCLSVALVGCEPHEDWPPSFPKSIYTLKQFKQGEDKVFEPAPELRKEIDEFLDKQFGTPANPKSAGATEERSFAIHKGSRLFRMHCMYCHGPAGGGDGASAKAYSPLPRDYRAGMFKWKSTPGNAKPLREDLLRTISHGVSGTSMPAFGRLALEQRQQLVEYVVFLSQRGETEFKLLNLATQAPQETGELKDFLEAFADDAKTELKKVTTSWESVKAAVVPPRNEKIDEDKALREASIERGKQLYLGPAANCVKCHGVDGKGRRQVLPNVEVTDDKDYWGHPAQPRDLNEGDYRGGRRMEDTYLRISQGIAASGMPAFANLKPDEIWDLVRFVRAVPYRPDLWPGGKALPEPPPGARAKQ